MARSFLPPIAVAVVPSLALAHPGHGPADPLAHALWHLCDGVGAVIAVGAVFVLAVLGILRLGRRLADAGR
jgi:hypothetical protein